MVYAAERLQESLYLNNSLKKSYKEVHRKFNENDAI